MMLSFLPAPIVGCIAGFLFLLNIVVIATLIILLGGIEFMVPFARGKQFLVKIYNDILPSVWTDINSKILQLAGKTEWIVQGTGTLNRDYWYFVFANHQSWADIIVMQQVFNRKIPLLKFFLKKELMWSLPLGGLACRILGYPFMKRHSKAYLKKHPEKKNEDLETTRKACHTFMARPTSVMNFLEGTRFTPQKQQDRSSPYKHLLRPKSGGLAYVIAAMQGYIENIVDVTIIYMHLKPTFWNLLCGRVPKIIVEYNVIPVDNELLGNYYEDPAFRRQFQKRINALWQAKDQLITKTLTGERSL